MKNPQTNFKRMPRGLLSGILLLLIVAIPASGQVKDSIQQAKNNFFDLHSYNREIYFGFSQHLSQGSYRYNPEKAWFKGEVLYSDLGTGSYQSLGIKWSWDSSRGLHDYWDKTIPAVRKLGKFVDYSHMNSFGIEALRMVTLNDVTFNDNSTLYLEQITVHPYATFLASERFYMGAGINFGQIYNFHQRIDGIDQSIIIVDNGFSDGKLSNNIFGFDVLVGYKMARIPWLKSNMLITNDIEIKRLAFYESIDPERNTRGFIAIKPSTEQLKVTSYVISLKIGFITLK